MNRRLWRAADGAQLAVLHGHGGRGVWRARSAGGMLASAGADASVKLWRLASWLPSQHAVGSTLHIYTCQSLLALHFVTLSLFPGDACAVADA
jgi:hypothetical protein